MDNNIFPLPFYIHLAFICIAFIIFIFQYSRKKRNYQLIMAIAFPITFLLYLNTGKIWHYSICIIELTLLIGAIVSVILDKKKLKSQKAEESKEEMEKV